MNDCMEDQAHDYSQGLMTGADYSCSTKECEFSTYDLDDLHKCGSCNKPFCPECLTAFPGRDPLCASCCVCSTEGCTEHALISCDECGKLACAVHLLKHPVLNVCSHKCARKAVAA